jgi:6-phosphogluconolactonase
LTWVDERLVPFAHESSNRGAAYRARQLDPSDPPGRELPLYVDGETADQALARVDAGLDEVFGGALDVLLLGLGEDGHIASLFPGHPWPASRVALVEASPKPPPRRLTLGLKILRTAREAILVVGGVTKEAALRRVLAGDRALPAASLENLRIATDLRLG